MHHINEFSIPIVYRCSTISWHECEICENNSGKSDGPSHSIITNNWSTWVEYFSSESRDLPRSADFCIYRISYIDGVELPYILCISSWYNSLGENRSICRYITLDYCISLSFDHVLQSIISDNMGTREDWSITSSYSHSSDKSCIVLILSCYLNRLIVIMSTGG